MTETRVLSQEITTNYPPSLGVYEDWDWPALFDAVLSVLRTPADANAWAAATQAVRNLAPSMVVCEPVLVAAWARFVKLYPMHDQKSALYYMRILLERTGRYSERVGLGRRPQPSWQEIEQEWQNLEVQQQSQERVLQQQHAAARESLEGVPALGDLGLSPRERAEWQKVQAAVVAALRDIVGPRGRISWTWLTAAQMQSVETAVIAAVPESSARRVSYLVKFELKRRRIKLAKTRETLQAERAVSAAEGAKTISNLAAAALNVALARVGISGPTVLSMGQYTKLATRTIPQEIRRLARLLPTAKLVQYSRTGRVLRRGRRARPYLEREARKQALASLRARGYERGPQPKEVRSCAAKGVIGALRGRRMPLSNFERKRIAGRYTKTGAPLRVLTPAQYNELVSASIKRVRVTCRRVKQTALQWKIAVERELKSRNYLPTAEQTRQAKQAAQVKPKVAPVTAPRPKPAPSPWMARRMAEAAARAALRGRRMGSH